LLSRARSWRLSKEKYRFGKLPGPPTSKTIGLWSS
jgi:hypothetical protein